MTVPCAIHPETATQRQVFRLAAWCSSPSSIPTLIDLVIPELEVARGGGCRAGKTNPLLPRQDCSDGAWGARRCSSTSPNIVGL